MRIDMSKIRGHIKLCKYAKFLEDKILENISLPMTLEKVWFCDYYTSGFMKITECLYQLSSEMNASEIAISESYLKFKNIIH